MTRGESPDDDVDLEYWYSSASLRQATPEDLASRKAEIRKMQEVARRVYQFYDLLNGAAPHVPDDLFTASFEVLGRPLVPATEVQTEPLKESSPLQRLIAKLHHRRRRRSSSAGRSSSTGELGQFQPRLEGPAQLKRYVANLRRTTPSLHADIRGVAVPYEEGEAIVVFGRLVSAHAADELFKAGPGEPAAGHLIWMEGDRIAEVRVVGEADLNNSILMYYGDDGDPGDVGPPLGGPPWIPPEPQ